MPVKDAQHFVSFRIGIATHAAIIHHDEESAIVLHAAQQLRDIHEMSSATVIRAHNVKFAIVPFVSPVRIQLQPYMCSFPESKFFYSAIPVLYPDEKLFGVAVHRIHAKSLIAKIEIQNPVVQEGAHLRRHIHTAIPSAILRSNQGSALRRRRASKNKHTCQATDYTRE